MPSSSIPLISIIFKWLLLLLMLMGLFILVLGLGSVSIPFQEVAMILLGGTPETDAWKTIVLDFRLPSAITAMLAGAALSISGLQMQTLFRNPLAGPFVLGINSGANLGVALVVLSGVWWGVHWQSNDLWRQLGLVGAAIIGANSVLAIVMLAAKKVQNNMTLLILGIMVGYATSSIVSILMYFSEATEIQAYIHWTFGSFRSMTWQQLPLFSAMMIIGMALSVLSVKPLNALLLGETYAASLGVSIRWTRFSIIGSTAILAGTTTAFCGPIGFLGVAVPHLCRGLFQTADHRSLIPSVALLGALIALMAELIAKLPGSQLTLPINAVTALIGAPVVIWVILKQPSFR